MQSARRSRSSASRTSPQEPDWDPLERSQLASSVCSTHFSGEHVTAGDLAEEAAHVEIDILGDPAGKQDHYIAAFGGITCFEFAQDGTVHVSPLSISTKTLHDLEEHLLMFFTGYSREAAVLLDDQKARTEEDDSRMVEALNLIEELGKRIRDALEQGDTARSPR